MDDSIVTEGDEIPNENDSVGADAGPATPVDPTIEWKSKVTYLSAEIENMRKRFVRERTDIVRFANETLLKSLLPVFDNLSLAVLAAKKGAETGEGPLLESMLKGMEMTLKSFEQSLEAAGVQTIKALGERFDPNVHEAMGQSSDASTEDDFITSELQRGFQLHGRTLRPARVIVNKITN